MKAKKKKRNTTGRHRRRNQVEGDTLPVGQFIAAEAVRLNADGTINVVIPDDAMPDSLSHDIQVTENRKRKRR